MSCARGWHGSSTQIKCCVDALSLATAYSYLCSTHSTRHPFPTCDPDNQHSINTQLVIRIQGVIFNLTINIQSTLNLWNTTVKYNHIRQTGELCSTHLLPTNHILLQTSDINNIQMFYIQYSTVYEFGLGRSACNLSCPGHHTYLFKPHSMLIKLV